MSELKKLFSLYKEKDKHFISFSYNFYKKWKFLIKIVIIFNKHYIPCEIYRKKFKKERNFVVVALKWNGQNVRRRISGFAKNFVKENRDAKCPYCETKLTLLNATGDHIIPISKGGTNVIVNIVVCCQKCNLERKNDNFYDFLRFKNPKYKNIKNIFF